MGAKDRILTNWLLNKAFRISSAPLNWVIQTFVKFNIGKILAIILLVCYSMPVLIVLMTLSVLANLIDSLIACIKYK